jgi:hypothetical protein
MIDLKLTRSIITKPSDIESDSIYGGKYQFKLNHTLGSLLQVFVKAKLSTGLLPNVLKNNFGQKILKSARIHNGSSTIANDNPFNSIARLDLLYDASPLYGKITSSTQPGPDAFEDSVYVYVYIPLFFFFSDSESEGLDLGGRNQLWLEIITNSSKEAIGMSEDFTSASFEMITYHRKKLVEPKIPKTIKNSYACFNELPVTVPSGATSSRILMTCPYPCFYVHFLVYRADGAKEKIEKIKINTPDTQLLDNETDGLYLLSDEYTGNDGSTISIKYGERNGSEKRFIKFSQEMRPTYAELTMAGTSQIRTVYITCEYYTNLVNDGPNIVNDLAGLFNNFY